MVNFRSQWQSYSGFHPRRGSVCIIRWYFWVFKFYETLSQGSIIYIWNLLAVEAMECEQNQGHTSHRRSNASFNPRFIDKNISYNTIFICRLDRYLIGSLVYRQLAALRQTSLARKLIGSMNFNTKRCVWFGNDYKV